MKTASAAVQSLLAGRNFWSCNLYAFTLVGGATLLYSGGDCDVVDPGTGLKFGCGGMVGPYFERTGQRAHVRQELGTKAAQVVFDVLPGESQVQGMPFLKAARQGMFRQAAVTLRRAYSPLPVSAASWPIRCTGTIVRFVGFVAGIDAGASLVTFTVNDVRARLQGKLPRNYYSPACGVALGQSVCGVDLTPYTVAATVAAGSTAGVLHLDLPHDTGHFDLGTVLFGSGANAGQKRSIRSWVAGAPGTLTLAVPVFHAPAVGDTLVLVPGCDGTTDAQGCPKFNNLSRFRGFLDIPAPTTAN